MLLTDNLRALLVITQARKEKGCTDYDDLIRTLAAEVDRFEFMEAATCEECPRYSAEHAYCYLHDIECDLDWRGCCEHPLRKHAETPATRVSSDHGSTCAGGTA